MMPISKYAQPLVDCKLQTMRRQLQRQCHICQRLGKAECGYHKFKDQFLSKLDGSSFRQNYFAQTQSSINGTSAYNNHKSHNNMLTPERVNRTVVNIQYSEPRAQQARPFSYAHCQTSQPLTPLHTSYAQQSVNTQQRVIPIENYVTRVQGNQVLYYPIYPVYQIVYEPVTNEQCSLSPSRLLSK